MFKRAFVVVYSKDHLSAVKRELSRAGYLPMGVAPPTLNDGSAVVFIEQSGLWWVHDRVISPENIDFIEAHGYIRIKKTRSIRKVLGQHTRSVDNQSVLTVQKKVPVLEPVVPPEPFIKPTATNPIVEWVVKVIRKPVAIVANIFNFFKRNK